MRRKIYRFVAEKIAKVKFGQMPPKWVKAVRWILFPLETHSLQSKWMKYNPARDTFTILGQEYSFKFFENIMGFMIGSCFRIMKRENGIIQMESMNQCAQRIYNAFPDGYDKVASAIDYIQNNYYTKDGVSGLGLGNVADLLFMTTGRQMDWKLLLHPDDPDYPKPEQREDSKEN